MRKLADTSCTMTEEERKKRPSDIQQLSGNANECKNDLAGFEGEINEKALSVRKSEEAQVKSNRSHHSTHETRSLLIINLMDKKAQRMCKQQEKRIKEKQKRKCSPLTLHTIDFLAEKHIHRAERSHVLHYSFTSKGSYGIGAFDCISLTIRATLSSRVSLPPLDDSSLKEQKSVHIQFKSYFIETIKQLKQTIY
uniref:Uncharacterized protein n=1 Tax=Glossina palpalis gambiensis TaxID=67801 RepID=A0A1B0BRT9_9MUSC